VGEAIAQDDKAARRHRLRERWSADMHAPMTPINASHRRLTAGWMPWLLRCFARFRERRLLRELSDDQLKDVGLTSADVARECRRWPWDGRAWD
jgi:uncharacterized protein YjiS (DUF1127 family)